MTVMDRKSLKSDLAAHGRVSEIAGQRGRHGAFAVQLWTTQRPRELFELLCVEACREPDRLVRLDVPLQRQRGLGSFEQCLADLPPAMVGLKPNRAFLDFSKNRGGGHRFVRR